MDLGIYGLALIAYCLTLLVLYKVYFFMEPRLRDASTWTSELYYRLLMRYRHDYGIEVWSDINNRWFFTDIFILLTQVILCLEFITVFGLVEMYNWNHVLKQIMIFHKQNPQIPRPIISPELLKKTNNIEWTYMTDLAFINLVLGAFLILLDNRFELMRHLREGAVADIATIGCLCFAGYTMVTGFNIYVAQCTIGQNELYKVI